MPDEIDFVFFDIGETLGERNALTGDFVPFRAVGRCLFVGENLIEVIGAIAAGMKAILGPCPPGRDLLL